MLLLVWVIGCVASPSTAVADPVTDEPEPWPWSSAGLTMPPVRAAFGPRKVVMLSAGHASTPTNRGNTGVHGQLEEESNLQAVLDLAERLEALDRFEIVLGRRPGERISYDARIERAVQAGADVLVELHTDVRGDLFPWARRPDGEVAYRVEGEPGFSVLFNEGAARPDDRARLASATATALARAGFPAYPGCHYEGLYIAGDTPGVYIDRRGLRMLRKPPMPSIIVETHNAVDYQESLRFREERTLQVFAAAMANALTDYLYPEAP